MPRNLPNLITAGRLVLALVLFVILALIDQAQGSPDADSIGSLVKGHERLWLQVAFVIFVVAAISDILDGQIARRWGLQTDFGRIVDPFADKVIVCGAFVQLVPLRGAQVASWMVVLILARELLVDGLRGFAEAKGVKFPAIWSGKLKMVAQSVCLSWILLALAEWPGAPWAERVSLATIWIALAVTLISGGQYVAHARSVLRSDSLTLLSPDPSAAPMAPAAPAGAVAKTGAP
jgi:CDP-diacylglycerol--glycerol-3-phosphate 3-phosphatidyltransferase